MATTEDLSEQQTETPGEFERSSQLFYEAERLRCSLEDATTTEQKFREAMDATGSYGVFYHLAQGRIYSLHGNIEYALTEFEIASEINNQIPAVFINLGLVYRQMAGRLRSRNIIDKADEMTQESIAVLRRILERHPENVDAWSALAMTYSKMGRDYLVDAENCVNRARELDPTNYEALTTLATLRSRTDKAAARKHALDAIALRPRSAFPYSILGKRDQSSRLEDSPKDAIVWLEKGLALRPNDHFLLSEMGKAYRELQNYPKAIEYFDRALKVGDDENESYGHLANRGESYRLNGQFAEAEADLRQALAIRPDFPFAMVSLRKLCRQLKRHEEGFAIARSLYEMSETQPNFKELQELQRLFQQDQATSCNITKRLIDTRADVNAIATLDDAKSAANLDSQNVDAFGLMGECLDARGQFQEARKCLDQALTLDPRAFYYRLVLGQVLEHLGEWKAAAREYRAYIKSGGRNSAGIEGLRRVEQRLGEERHEARVEGAAIVFLNSKTGREERHPVKLIHDFLYDRMNDWKLPIRDIIEQIGKEPVFIIAKTGVGKTVTVPTKILLGLCDDLLKAGADLAKRFPQVYVVEPRIPICTMTMAEMNDGYQDYVAYRMIDDAGFRNFLTNEGIRDITSKDRNTVGKIVELAYNYVRTGKAPYDPRHFNLYGCITSASGKINGDAPILFVTTGIMESLTFEGTKLDPKYHRIIVDEAHVTIEANPSIELGIALARKRGVKIDYMSATVDPATLHSDLGVKIVYAEAQRFPIHLTNLNATVEESILHLVKNFLLAPDKNCFPNPHDFSDPAVRAKVERVRLHLLSENSFQDGGRTYPGLRERPQGMLVIVNSHQNENSDTHRIADLIARADFNRPKTRVETLRLASPIVRDPALKLAFDRKIQNIEGRNGRYVIVATNVVEMGLTFSSIDYVVTMDSEFDTKFVDGGQLTTKVELGVNALYQRIGRAGRVRPGMAFIAQDFGASYTTLDDQTLAAGLTVAPIRYPLAKGSFLKLALYSFREKMPQNELRDKITALNLPSRIQDNDELWRRFLAERSRLQRIGIASGDKLTGAGTESLRFIGLDDMDFAVLLARVIDQYGIESDLAAIFTVIAAASEVGFSQLMTNRFFLTNTKQLSAVELFDEAMLGIPVAEVFTLVKQHEGDAEALSVSLRATKVDDQLCSDICACVRAGYKLAYKSGVRVNQTSAPATAENPTGSSNKVDYPVEEEQEELESADDNADDGTLFSDFKRELDKYSTEHTLAFERAVVSFSDQSELINIYRLFRHFFNNYFVQLKSTSLSELEKSELRRSMEDEASKLQVSMPALNNVNGRFNQLARHVGVRLAQEEGRRVSSSSLNENEKQMLRDSIVRDLLFEREGGDEQFDLCMRFYKLADERRFDPRDCEWMVEELKNFGYTATGAEVKELWHLIVREAFRRYDQQCFLFDFDEAREVLPPISKRAESELLRIVRDHGYHRRLVFSKNDFGYSAVVKDQLGGDIELSMSKENNPLGSGFSGKDSITVLAKLTPAMIPKVLRDDNKNGEFIKQEEQGFRLSHVTLLS
ncbi:MAG: tetratricopeptide repeat protein [Verrucomicrobiota bacterium]|jgi:tetratricopeptide (TPR) repeat protein